MNAIQKWAAVFALTFLAVLVALNSGNNGPIVSNAGEAVSLLLLMAIFARVVTR